MSRMEPRLAAAKALEGRLRAEGRHDDAERVAALRRSAIAARETCRALHRDNMDLRRRLGEPPLQLAALHGEGEG